MTIEPGRLRCRGERHKPGCAHLGNDLTRTRCRGGAHVPGCRHLIPPYSAGGTGARQPASARDIRAQKAGLIPPKVATLAPAYPPENWGVSDLVYEAGSVTGTHRGKVVGRLNPAGVIVRDAAIWAWNEPCPACNAKTQFGYCTRCVWVCDNAARPAPESIIWSPIPRAVELTPRVTEPTVTELPTLPELEM